MKGQADNITMSGGGLYSLATLGAKHVIDKTIPRVLDALGESAAIKSDQTHFTFSDMGCADGGTSLELWRSVIGHLRQSTTSDIQVIYADQPRNAVSYTHLTLPTICSV